MRVIVESTDVRLLAAQRPEGAATAGTFEAVDTFDAGQAPGADAETPVPADAGGTERGAIDAGPPSQELIDALGEQPPTAEHDGHLDGSAALEDVDAGPPVDAG